MPSKQYVVCVDNVSHEFVQLTIKSVAVSINFLVIAVGKNGIYSASLDLYVDIMW